MKSRIKLLGLIALSIIINVYLFWITFIFNPQFYGDKAPTYIIDYHNKNGHIHLLVFLLLIVVFSILFLLYAYSDNKKTLVFEHKGEVDFYQNDNLFSFKRIFQYISLAIALIAASRSFIRSITLDFDYLAYYIFTTDIIFTLFDMVLIFFGIFTILLIFELIEDFKITYH